MSVTLSPVPPDLPAPRPRSRIPWRTVDRALMLAQAALLGTAALIAAAALITALAVTGGAS